MLKVCFIGLGSIGRRHITNLVYLLKRNHLSYQIDAVRSTTQELPSDIKELLSEQYCQIADIPLDYDIIFITNPTVYHLSTIEQALKHSKHLFIEKPIFGQPLKDIDVLPLQKDSIYYVACPLRYSAVYRYIQENINPEEIFAARAISSSYLPEWRKNSDYRQNYSAKKEEGGGVSLDLIHEIDYVTDFFGIPQEVLHVANKVSSLEISSDDIATYILSYENRTVEIHLDYFGRKTRRNIELFGKDYVITCDFINNVIEYSNNEKVDIKTLPASDMYLEEMRYFLDIIHGKSQNRNDVCHANDILKIAVKGC